jgi:hypothetical protein
MDKGDYAVYRNGGTIADDNRTNFSILATATENVIQSSSSSPDLEQAAYSGVDGYSSNFILFKTEIIDGTGNVVTVDNSGSYTKITAIRDGTAVWGGVTIIDQSNNNWVQARVFDSTDTLRFDGTTAGHGDTTASDYRAAPFNFVLDAGDYLVFRTSSQPDDASTTRFWLTARAPLSSTIFQVPNKKVAYIKDVKSEGTNGGTFNSGAWQTRDLNTTEGDTFVSLSSNQFTLPAGTYDIEASAPAFRVASHQARLQNITEGSTAITGSTAYSGSSDNYALTSSFVLGRLTLDKETTFEIQHRCQSTQSTSGFGADNNFGEDNTYTQVKIEKIL